MNSHPIQLMSVLLIMAGSSMVGIADDDNSNLLNNPFKQPDLSVIADNSNDSDPLADQPGSQLELRATLTLGKRSLANVGGKIIGIGELIDGYRLLSVAEGEAAFAKNGAHITLVVGDDTEGSQNE